MPEEFKLTDEIFNKIFPFKNPREDQREIIEKILSSYQNGYKYVILDAPCGTGKSVIGYSIASYFKSAYFLTNQKILQNQYYNDFKIPFVLGRNNYTCQKNKMLTCEMGACFRISKKFCKNKGLITCPYLIQRDNCFKSNFSNLSYSYFLSMIKNASLVTERNLIICDEAHLLEGELIKSSNVKLNDSILKFLGLVKIKLPKINNTDEFKLSWLFGDVLEDVKPEYLNLKNRLSKLTELKSTIEYHKISKRYNALEKLLMSIINLKEQYENSTKIIIIQTNNDIEFKPLFADKSFKKDVDNLGQHFLFMSGTILNKNIFCKNLGINPDEAIYLRCESKFPIENRIIHYNPIGSLSFKNKQKTFPKLISTIDKILKENKDVKGIIHTINYEIAEKIIEGLRFSDQASRLLMPKGNGRQQLLDIFYESKKPYVLISPSLMEGIDLKEDLSRLCIICKVPYLNLGDQWVNERMKLNYEWYLTAACISLIQMSGRSIRSETDFAKTYILDKDFEKLAEMGQEIFPDWWKDSVIID